MTVVFAVFSRAVREASADAVKFQIFAVEEAVSWTHPDYDYLHRISFSAKQWEEIIWECANTIGCAARNG